MQRSNAITWDQVRVGVVLIVSLIVLAFGVFFIGQIGNVFGERYKLVTLMESASGLIRGAQVQVAGQNVGQVDRVEFIQPEDRPVSGEAIAVWIDVSVTVQDQIRDDSRARVRTEGLLGDRLIDIEPGSAGKRVLVEGDTIQGAPAISYEELLGQAADAVQSLTILSNDLTETLSKVASGEGSLGQLLVDDGLYGGMLALNQNLNAIIEPISSGQGTFGQLLMDDELYDRLVSTAAGLDSVTHSVVTGEGSLGRLIGSDSLYLALISSANRADSLLSMVEGGEGLLAQLVSDEQLYEELLKTVVDLNAFLADVRENPEKFIPTIKVF